MVERNRTNQSTSSAGTSGGGQSQPSTPGGMAHQQATQVKEQVQQTASDLKDQVTEQATGKIEEQKTAASGSLNTVAHAVRQTADQLEENDQEAIARYVHRAASQVENIADYIGRRDLRGLAQDAEQFARREPALFLGGAFALGLFAARFLKSSGSAGGGMSGQSSAGNNATTLALPPTSSYQPSTNPRPTTAAMPSTTPRPATAPMSSTTPPMTSTPQPTMNPSMNPSSASASGRGTTPTGGAADEDVIVGGPPISPDVIVGGPPRKPGQEPR